MAVPISRLQTLFFPLAAAGYAAEIGDWRDGEVCVGEDFGNLLEVSHMSFRPS